MPKREPCRKCSNAGRASAKGEDAVDHGAQAVLGDDAVHLLQVAAAADADRAERRDPGEDAHQVRSRAGPRQAADEGDGAAHGERLHRLGDRPADLDDQVHAAVVGELADRGAPVRRLDVVHDVAGAEGEQLLRLGLAGGGGDHPSAGNVGELQREQRHAAAALHQHGVAGPDAGHCRPAGQGGARQRRGLLEAEVLGHVHQCVRVDHDVLGEPAVDVGAVHLAELPQRAAVPVRGERVDHAVAGLEPSGVRPDGLDHARGVGELDQVRQRRPRVDAVGDHRVAGVEGGGLDADQDLAASGRGRGAVHQFEGAGGVQSV
ncbi:hypothetical protein BJ998_006144 [Kutzneria kofuensis]|uniref:Uncharacterized protein n=1 Tax=Kutzneria kofuensis TaxID=103725 RepID=A0A7W9KMC9_9PSEU|nr:hypothetical protein [Kutzneria kofuensis]